MRDPNLEYMFTQGLGVLQTLFDVESPPELLNIKQVSFWYPERYLNIVEERSLLRRLDKSCPQLEQVEIITQSVYLLQTVSNKDIKILSSEEEDRKELQQESDTGKLWNSNITVPDFGKIQTFKRSN
jgi:hypothetical protein